MNDSAKLIKLDREVVDMQYKLNRQSVLIDELIAAVNVLERYIHSGETISGRVWKEGYIDEKGRWIRGNWE